MLSLIITSWRQLSYQKMKLGAAIAGVSVAVMLMLMQLGLRQGALDGSVAFARRINADIVLVSPFTNTTFQSAQFPRRLLYRCLNHDQVARVQEAYSSVALWKNPWKPFTHPIAVYGLNPEHPMIDLPGLDQFITQLRERDTLLFDQTSRTVYGPVLDELKKNGSMNVDLNRRRLRIIGTTRVGASFVNDGTVYMNCANFQRLFPNRTSAAIDFGLIRLKPGADAKKVAATLKSLVGPEVIVYTREEFVATEIKYVKTVMPLDFIFGLGAIVGFFIGFVVVYQILYTEVTNKLPQFATLKAIGFTDGYLLWLVLSQAIMLSLMGYVPGFIMAIQLYKVATREIQIEFYMTNERAFGVLFATLLMCSLSAMVAIRKAQTADPAEVF